MTIDQARQLKTGQYVYSKTARDCNKKTPMRYKVGKIKLWVTRPTEFRISLSRGLYEHYQITQADIVAWDDLTLTVSEAL